MSPSTYAPHFEPMNYTGKHHQRYNWTEPERAQDKFLGHLAPGILLFVLAFWWTVQILQRYFQSLQPGTNCFQSSLTFPSSSSAQRWKNIHIEAWFKIFTCLLGTALMLGGFYASQYRETVLPDSMVNQHVTMFLTFGLAGAVDLAMHRNWPIPAGLDYAVMCLCLGIWGMTFAYHSHSTTSVKYVVHMLLLYIVKLNIVALLLEMANRASVLRALFRCFCLQGMAAWFFVIAFTLGHPFSGPDPVKWNEDMGTKWTVLTMYFVWALTAVLLEMTVVAICIGRKYKYT